jgi:hypothetical protein
MPPARLIAGFLWRFALVYGLLILPWPGFNDAYGRYFRGLGQAAFAREHAQRQVRFEAVPKELKHVLDTRIVLANRDLLDPQGYGPVKYLELDTRGIGWVPTALLLALVVATPVPWRRRIPALGWGLLAVHGYIWFSVAVHLWNNSGELSLVSLTPFWQRVAGGLDETLVVQMGASFVVPVFLWLLVTLRKQDVIAWQGTSGGRNSPRAK